MKQHSTKVFRDIVNALGSFIQSLFIVPNVGNVAAVGAPAGKLTELSLFRISIDVKEMCSNGPEIQIYCTYTPLPHSSPAFVVGGSGSGAQGTAQGGPGTGGVSGTLTTQAAFEYRGTWIPLMTVSVQGSAKAT